MPESVFRCFSNAISTSVVFWRRVTATIFASVDAAFGVSRTIAFDLCRSGFRLDLLMMTSYRDAVKNGRFLHEVVDGGRHYG